MLDIKLEDLLDELLENKIQEEYRLGLLLDRKETDEFIDNIQWYISQSKKPKAKISLSASVHLWMVRTNQRFKKLRRKKK